MIPKKKSCVIFSETYIPLVGGAEIYTYNLAKQLTLRGYNVVVFTYKTNLPASEYYHLNGVVIKHVSKVSKVNIIGVVILFYKIWHLLNKSDLVFVNYTHAFSTLSVLAGAISRKPVSVFAHGMGTIIDDVHPKIYYLYRFVTLKLAKNIITTSEELADIIKKYNSNVLVATAVDYKMIDSEINLKHIEEIKLKTKKKIILSVRRLVEKNGIQYLIEAVSFLQKLRKDFIYVVIGDGRLRNELEKRATKLSLLDNILFLGVLQNSQVFDYIKAADVVVFPSSAEALSLAAIETMYIGTPILVSNIGGLRELVGNNAERGTVIDLFGRVVSIYSAPDIHTLSNTIYKQFADKLNIAISNIDEIQNKATVAKKYVSIQYDWSHVADKILYFIA